MPLGSIALDRETGSGAAIENSSTSGPSESIGGHPLSVGKVAGRAKRRDAFRSDLTDRDGARNFPSLPPSAKLARKAFGYLPEGPLDKPSHGREGWRSPAPSSRHAVPIGKELCRHPPNG